MAEKVKSFLNAFHAALNCSGAGFAVPSYLSKSDMEMLSDDWARLCADGRVVLNGHKELRYVG